MTFASSISVCFRKAFVWSGRAARSEYWWFVLFTMLVGAVGVILDYTISGEFSDDPGPIEALLNLILLFPSLAASVRRLHDTGRSAWYLLCPFAAAAAGIAIGALIGSSLGQGGPIIVGIVILLGFGLAVLWTVQKGTRGDNAYGPDPLGQLV